MAVKTKRKRKLPTTGKVRKVLKTIEDAGKRNGLRPWKDVLREFLHPGRPLSPMVWGHPGIGKSMIVAKAAKAAGAKVVNRKLRMVAPADLRGIPTPRGWAEASNVLYLDELNQAPPAVRLATEHFMEQAMKPVVVRIVEDTSDRVPRALLEEFLETCRLVGKVKPVRCLPIRRKRARRPSTTRRGR